MCSHCNCTNFIQVLGWKEIACNTGLPPGGDGGLHSHILCRQIDKQTTRRQVVVWQVWRKSYKWRHCHLDLWHINSKNIDSLTFVLQNPLIKFDEASWTRSRVIILTDRQTDRNTRQTNICNTLSSGESNWYRMYHTLLFTAPCKFPLLKPVCESNDEHALRNIFVVTTVAVRMTCIPMCRTLWTTFERSCRVWRRK